MIYVQARTWPDNVTTRVTTQCGDCAETVWKPVQRSVRLRVQQSLCIDNAAQAWGLTRIRQKDLEQPRTTVKKDRLESYD